MVILWVSLWSSSFSLCFVGVNISCVCGIQTEFKSSALSLVMLSKTSLQTQKEDKDKFTNAKRVREGRFFVFSKTVFRFESKHATVNKPDDRKDQIYAPVNATSEIYILQRPLQVFYRTNTANADKNVTLNIKTYESLNVFFLNYD